MFSFLGVYIALAFTLTYLIYSFSRRRYWKNELGQSLQGEALSLYPGELHKPVFLGPHQHSKYEQKGIYFLRSMYQRVVILSTRKVTKDFYCLEHDRDPQFGLLGNICQELMGNSIGVAYGDKWKRIHKAFADHFTSTKVSEHFDAMLQSTQHWFETLKDSFKVFRDRLDRLPLYIISQLVYGTKLANQHKQFIEKVAEEHSQLMNQMRNPMTRVPLVGRYFSKLKTLKFRKGWRLFNKSLLDNFDKRPSECDPKAIFFSISAKWRSDPNIMTEEEFFDTIDEILLLNADVTYVAMGWVAANLAKHPTIQTKVREEFNKLNGQKIGLQAINNLRYMDSVIKESARLCPSLALTFPVKLAADARLGGYLIPAGTVVLTDIITVNRDPQIWKAPDQFDPELNQIASHISDFHRFGLGYRKCLGLTVASAMIKAFVFTLLKNCEISVDKKESWDKIRKEGLVFFTPFTHFPEINISRFDTSLKT